MRLLDNKSTVTLRDNKKIKPNNPMENNASQESDSLLNWSKNSQLSMEYEDELPSQHPINESSSQIYFF